MNDHTKGSEPSDDPRSHMAAWTTTIEEHLRKYDEGLIKDLDDDIDTLLVFAGLFSAVLSAFVVQSYQLLQEDYQQTSAQLLAQLVALQTGGHSQLPSPLPPFSASTAAVWINALWFISLILSLAAALFAMMGKQWLREYMRWTKMSSPPSDLIFLRQIRFEALMDWNTPAIVSTIPALLQLALSMFLAGLVVLLWTLNDVVAKISTVTVCSVILLAVTTTILPAFFPRCPYKTPTGWAFVMFGHFFFQICSSIYVALRTTRISNPTTLIPVILKSRLHQDWRRRDIHFHTNSRDICAGPFLQEVIDQGSEDSEVLENVQQLATFFRVILWIRQTSRSGPLLDAIEQYFAVRHIGSPISPLDMLRIDLDMAYKLLDLSNPPSMVGGALIHGWPIIDNGCLDASILKVVARHGDYEFVRSLPRVNSFLHLRDKQTLLAKSVGHSLLQLLQDLVDCSTSKGNGKGGDAGKSYKNCDRETVNVAMTGLAFLILVAHGGDLKDAEPLSPVIRLLASLSSLPKGLIGFRYALQTLHSQLSSPYLPHLPRLRAVELAKLALDAYLSGTQDGVVTFAYFSHKALSELQQEIQRRDEDGAFQDLDIWEKLLKHMSVVVSDIPTYVAEFVFIGSQFRSWVQPLDSLFPSPPASCAEASPREEAAGIQHQVNSLSPLAEEIFKSLKRALYTGLLGSDNHEFLCLMQRGTTVTVDDGASTSSYYLTEPLSIYRKTLHHLGYTFFSEYIPRYHRPPRADQFSGGLSYAEQFPTTAAQQNTDGDPDDPVGNIDVHVELDALDDNAPYISIPGTFPTSSHIVSVEDTTVNIDDAESQAVDCISRRISHSPAIELQLRSSPPGSTDSHLETSVVRCISIAPPGTPNKHPVQRHS